MKMLVSFWWLLTMTCVVWYCTITLYVTARGIFDIRGMLRRLRDQHKNQENLPS